jgi:hypothetical protein
VNEQKFATTRQIGLLRRRHNLDDLKRIGKSNMLSALYFPTLRPNPAWIAAISTLVDRLVCYGAVEGGEPVPGCEARVAAPLGPERERFLALLREMTGRDAEYFKGQLAMPAFGPGRDRDEASGRSLTAALQRRKGGAAAELARARIERLWQARLMLSLAEKVSVAEAEIHQELAAATRKQKALLRALQGEGDEAEESRPLSSPALGSAPRSYRMRDLLGAWAVLFAEDRSPESFLVTDDQEAGELLLDEVERRTPGAGLYLADLPLPLPAGSVAPDAAGEKARKDLAAALAAVVAHGLEATRARLEEAVGGWGKSFSGQGIKNLPLRLYLLPADPVRQALAALSGLKAAGAGALAEGQPMLLLGVATYKD